VKKRELYFVISSLNRNLSPSLALELLESIVDVSIKIIIINFIIREYMIFVEALMKNFYEQILF
jgi:hypothetical protein